MCSHPDHQGLFVCSVCAIGHVQDDPSSIVLVMCKVCMRGCICVQISFYTESPFLGVCQMVSFHDSDQWRQWKLHHNTTYDTDFNEDQLIIFAVVTDGFLGVAAARI